MLLSKLYGKVVFIRRAIVGGWEEKINMRFIKIVVIVACAFFVIFVHNKESSRLRKEQEAKALGMQSMTEKELAVFAPSKTAQAQVIVGANPMIGKTSKLSPPTNSVVITSEQHLQSLIEQEKAARLQL